MADDPSPRPAGGPPSTGRRRFLGYVLAAPTLIVAAQLGAETAHPQPAAASIPSPPEPADLMDLGDALTLAALPTSGLITIGVDSGGRASFAMPRAEVGQGISTAIAMLIAEELDLPLDRVDVTLADARPELVFNQFTGGSNTIRSMYRPVRTAAAIARARLLAAAADRWQVPVSSLSTHQGVVTSSTGRTATYGSLAEAAASEHTTAVSVSLKDSSAFALVGTPQNRLDARDSVTGRKKFALDLDVCPGAKPTMVRRPPTINGTVDSVANLAAVRAMPGVTDVAVVSTGVAVRGETFGQCVDAVRALEVTWHAGSVDGESDDTVLAKLKAATAPLAVPALPGVSVDAEFVFAFASNSALETNNAIADVRADRAEIWSSLKSPIDAQQTIAGKLGLPQSAVTVHVTEGGGSFGRKLFFDAALEAAEISQKMGKPVKLMWHRTDDFRHGRAHPMCLSRIRVTYALGNVLSYEQRHTSVATDFTHGLGEALTATAAKLPVGGLGFSQTVFELTQTVPYDFGATTQVLTEVPLKFHTGSMRDVYSPNVVCARELVVDRLAAKMRRDPVAFRRSFLKQDRYRAVLDKVAELGHWGRAMPAGTAQGVAVHTEFKGCTAVLVEIDCRPETTGRKIPDAVTGPRVTRVVMAVDVGLPVNPRGLEAQMIGCVSDGIGLALTESLHVSGGLPLEGSWDEFFYTRQWNTPADVRIMVMPPTTGEPGGAGELGVAGVFAAVACAYARATGTMPTRFPVNHGTLSFDPLPREPSIPQSPTDGLDHAF
jgi:isoquinoline 1-oxidoreductase subunit beta